MVPVPDATAAVTAAPACWPAAGTVASTPPLASTPEAPGLVGNPRSRPGRARPSRIPWAELLQRVFAIDVLACPCGGRRKVLACLTDPKVVKQILEHLGLPATGPPVAPPRTSALPDEACWQDDLPELQQSLR